MTTTIVAIVSSIYKDLAARPRAFCAAPAPASSSRRVNIRLSGRPQWGLWPPEQERT